jgi:large subunit ribosomal protein L4
MNKKTKKIALISSLALKLKDDRILGLKSYASESIKTSHVTSIIRSIGLQSQKTLFVIPEGAMHMAKSIRNIEKASYVRSNYLNPYDIINAQKIVFVEGTVDAMQTLLAL